MPSFIRNLALSLATLCFAATGLFAEDGPRTLWRQRFDAMPYGHIPDGWRDLVERRPNRNWIVDVHGNLRTVLKGRTGLIAYDGYFRDGTKAAVLGDCVLAADFEKTEDDGVTFGVAARIVDEKNYYLARFGGDDRLELLKVVDGREQPLDLAQPVDGFAPRPTGMVTLDRYRYGEHWTLELALDGEHIAAVVYDAADVEQARLEALDSQFTEGRPGLCCTPFAAARLFQIDALEAIEATKSRKVLQRRNELLSEDRPEYPIVPPIWNHANVDTRRDELSPEYDVVVAGAGTGGWAAAVQAARLGVKVLLLEETDWIGGQMACAGVTTMDEDSVWHKFPVRERGLYREFHESITAYYHSLDKDPNVAYYSWPEQLEGGYEPKAARAVLYGLIREAREREGTLDVSLRSRVVAVKKDGNTVRGATIEFVDGAGDDKEVTTRRDVACRILIDATEYGDVLPLTGARYRVGNVTNERPDPKALVQDHTWTAIVREYPDGVPEHLQIHSPPPGYEEHSGRRFQKFENTGAMVWGAAGKGLKGPRHWRVYFAWRGMADSDSPLVGLASSRRHTQCGFNGGNDYPVTAATIEDPYQRKHDEREGIYLTLGALFYFQQELGVPWSLAEDEGYDTPANRAKMWSLDLREDLLPLAIHLPQQPYVRESRRMIGVRTLVAADLTRFEEAKLFPTSVAMGDYFMDLDHGKTAQAVEADLDSGEPPRGGGPFQVPFEALLPETLDGFLAAEKNFSQSRLANGATRLQPITMLTGQAVGATAALAVRRGVHPRELSPREVQAVLLDAGCTLVQRWYEDVEWGTPLWRATQLLSLYQVLDRPGPIDKNNETPLGFGSRWKPNDPLKPAEANAALARLAEVCGIADAPRPALDGDSVSAAKLKRALTAIRPAWGTVMDDEVSDDSDTMTTGELALVAAGILRSNDE